MGRTNNFGALRLLFAVLVILSHSFELIDGNRSREILTRLFGTLSFGELAVDGFFLISGYLITKSFQDSGATGAYLFKRVLRIYPGYVVAYLLCLLALGPVAGGRIATLSVVRVLERLILLLPPEMNGVFARTHYPDLNGSMWTIGCEFRCYLLVPILGLTGLLARRSGLAVLTAGLLALSAVHQSLPGWLPEGLTPYLDALNVNTTFAGVFGCGALFYLYRDSIAYEWRSAALAACGLVVLLASPHLAEPALAIFGGYVLFWFAFKVKSPTLAAIGSKVDISYGVYLYAWPVQKSLIWLDPGITPWRLFIEATAATIVLACGSWWLVEQPFLRLKAAVGPAIEQRRRPGPDTAPASVY